MNSHSDLPLKDLLIYQDEDILIAHKPPFVLTHPWKKVAKESLDLMNLIKAQTNAYLYPVHRLDRQVSGVVVFALNKKANRVLKEKWNEDSFKKNYLTLCRGHMTEKGTFDFDLKIDKKKNIWKSATTHYQPLAYFPPYDCSLVQVRIETGRKHQIRRHFSRRHFNLIGDSKYGHGAVNIIFKQMGLERVFLHAYKLQIIHPITNKTMSFVSPLEQDLMRLLARMAQEIGREKEEEIQKTLTLLFERDLLKNDEN